MKRMLKLICVTLSLLLLAACGGQATPAPETGSTAPATTTPTEAKTTFPKPDKLIALTFDDGPGTAAMVDILNTLEQYDAKATFFVIGRKIDGTTSPVLKRAYDMGCEIGNHSFNHVDLTELTEEEILAEVEKTQAAVEAVTGERPVWFRAPFLKANETVFTLIDMPFAGSGVSAGDGTEGSIAMDRFYKISNGAYDGVIALMHCYDKADETAEAVRDLVPYLMEQGYELVTVSEMFQRMGVTPDTTVNGHYKDVNTVK